MATVATLLREHVSLRVRSVNRLFLAGYVPKVPCTSAIDRLNCFESLNSTLASASPAS
jgi:hypothetical protein